MYLDLEEGARFSSSGTAGFVTDYRLLSNDASADYYLEDAHITAIASIGENSVWIGTFSGRVYRFNLNQRTLIELPLPQAFDQVRGFALHAARQEVWMGSSLGLLCYNLVTQEFRDISALHQLCVWV